MLKLTRIRLAAGIALAAAAFPAAAQARFELDPPGGGAVAPPVQAEAPQPPVASVSGASNGFQWGDAGIGAGSTVVLLGAGAVAAWAGRRRRSQRAIAS
jgi:hypothetical protein